MGCGAFVGYERDFRPFLFALVRVDDTSNDPNALRPLVLECNEIGQEWLRQQGRSGGALVCAGERTPAIRGSNLASHGN